MTPRFDDDKGALQFRLAVQRKHSLKFGMHRILRRGEYTKVNDAGPASLNENKPAKIAVAGHEDSLLLVRDPQQFRVIRLRQSKLSGPNNIMSQTAQKVDRDGVNILIGEKFHGVAAR